LTAQHGVVRWILSLVATRASRSAKPVEGLASVMSGIYGRRLLASLRKWSPASCSLRTCQGTYRSASTLFATTFTEWAFALRQDCSLRQKSARRIAANACSSSASWPMATAGDAKSSGAAGYGPTATHHVGTTLTDATERLLTWPTPNAASDRRNRGTGVDPKIRAEQGRQIMLQDVVKVWPTPRTITGGGESTQRKQELGRTASGGGDLQAASQTWPTPGANDHKRSAREGQRMGQLDEAAEQLWPTPQGSMTAGEDLRATWTPGEKPVREDGRVLQTALTTCTQIWDRSRPGPPTPSPGGGSSSRGPTSRPRLNPTFVEWLMGLPLGWTDFAPSATEWSRWSLLMRSCLFGLVSARVATS
jgi:hypothetical protein